LIFLNWQNIGVVQRWGLLLFLQIAPVRSSDRPESGNSPARRFRRRLRKLCAYRDVGWGPCPSIRAGCLARAARPGASNGPRSLGVIRPWRPSSIIPAATLGWCRVEILHATRRCRCNSGPRPRSR